MEAPGDGLLTSFLFLETCGAACPGFQISFVFPLVSPPRFPRVGFNSLLTDHERLEHATCGAFEIFVF